MAIWLGAISVICSLIYALVILILKLVNPGAFVVGWTSIILITIFFGGVQLLSVGILGEYIGSLFDEAKDRPEYIVENTVNI